MKTSEHVAFIESCFPGIVVLPWQKRFIEATLRSKDVKPVARNARLLGKTCTATIIDEL
jgi:hypothetical protein